MATAQEKIITVSRQLTLDLTPTGPAQYNAFLERYSQTYGVRFLLYETGGRQIAGPAAARCLAKWPNAHGDTFPPRREPPSPSTPGRLQS